MGDRASYRTHFFQHNWKTAPPPHDVTDTCHWCQIRLFPAHDRFPITIVNTTGDGARFPDGFRFLTHSILTEGVEAAGASFRSGCSCADPAACEHDGCECLEDMDWDSSDETEPPADSDSDDDDASKQDDGHVSGQHGGPSTVAAQPDSSGRWSKHAAVVLIASSSRTTTTPTRQRRWRAKFAYHSRGAQAGMLRSRVLKSRDPIYECHEACACQAASRQPGRGCANRVVECGRQIPLQIFRTRDRGWGVRTLVDLQQGQFVDLYMGEVLPAQEANRRRAEASTAGRKDVYLFALDKFSDAASLDQRLAGPPLEVDGEFRSGPTRFINHSCSPNLRIFARVGDHANKHIHELAFFAVHAIHAGTELTFDYTGGSDDAPLARDARRLADGMSRCLCKSANCRGFLW